MKRILLALVFTFFLATSASANSTCPVAQVIQTGAFTSGGSAILLYNLESGVTGWDVSTYKWFFFDRNGDPESGGDAMLATALTAVVTGRYVQVCPKNSESFTSWGDLGQIWVLNYDYSAN